MATKRAKKSAALLDPMAYRTNMGLNQTQFWGQYGVTQSGGSRYENNRAIPTPVAMLMVLQEQGKITEDDLGAALASVQASKA